MDLPEALPDDIDYAWYVNECEEILMTIGAKVRPVTAKLPRKNSKAWLALRDQGKTQPGKRPTDKWRWVS